MEVSMRSIALVCLALTACSSSYLPQSRGRVAIVMRDGRQAYARDGQIIEHGFLGGGLAEAVHGHPGAMVAANEYRDRLKWGLLGTFGGLGCMLGGLAYAAARADARDDGDDLTAGTKRGLWISLGCSIVLIVGAAYLGTAEPYRWDAINMFNDAPLPPMPLPGAPGAWSAQKTSLKMRD
jgi:hypothetical protein